MLPELQLPPECSLSVLDKAGWPQAAVWMHGRSATCLQKQPWESKSAYHHVAHVANRCCAVLCGPACLATAKGVLLHFDKQLIARVVPVCRALQPELRGGMTEVLVTCLVFIGALAGSIVPVAFNLEYQATTTAKRLPNNLYSLVRATLGTACLREHTVACCFAVMHRHVLLSLACLSLSQAWQVQVPSEASKRLPRLCASRLLAPATCLCSLA